MTISVRDPNDSIVAGGAKSYVPMRRLRRVRRTLALAHPPMLPSAWLNGVRILVAITSQLNCPASRCPFQRFYGSLAAGHA